MTSTATYLWLWNGELCTPTVHRFNCAQPIRALFDLK